MASGAPIVDTKSKEYRREAMFLVLNVLRDLIVFIYLPFIVPKMELTSILS